MSLDADTMALCVYDMCVHICVQVCVSTCVHVLVGVRSQQCMCSQLLHPSLSETGSFTVPEANQFGCVGCLKSSRNSPASVSSVLGLQMGRLYPLGALKSLLVKWRVKKASVLGCGEH